MGLSDEISWAMRAAPQEVRQDPSIALVAAQTPGDTQTHAEVMSHMLNQKAIGQAVDDVGRHHGGKGVFGATLGWLGEGVKGAMDFVGHGVQTVGHVANMPLEQVKQQYRYLRDVQSRHGFGAMLMDAIPMTAGAVAGGLLAGPGGIAIGLAAAGQLHEEIDIPGMTHKDSWERTAEGYKDPRGGQAVSPGRDAARMLNFLTKHIGVHVEQHAGFDLYDAVSGLGDGIFSVVADPLAGAGMARKQTMAGEEIQGVITRKLAPTWGGIAAAKETELAPLVAQNVPVRRAFEHLASMDSAGDIGARYRKLRPFAHELAEADTVEKVGQVFQDRIAASQYMQRTLPRRTVANATFGDLLRGADAGLRGLAFQGLQEVEEGGRTVLRGAEAGLPTKAVRKVGSAYNKLTTYVPTSYNDAINELSRTTFYLNDDAAAGTVYDLARWGHTDRMAKHVATQYGLASIADKQIIFRNVLADNLGNVMELTHPGWVDSPEGAETLANLGAQLDGLFGGIDAGRTTPWGYGKDGKPISRILKDGETISAPILEKQMINVPLPDFMTYQHQLVALRNGQTSKFLAGADDFLYNQFTQRVFRRWALLSGGFALRAAAQDVIPYIVKAPMGMLGAGLSHSMAKRGWHIEPDEEQHILAAMTGWLAKHTGQTEDDIAEAAMDIHAVGAHRITEGVSTGHSGPAELVGVNEYVNEELYSKARDVPRMQRDPSVSQAWAAGHQDFNIQWHAQAKTMAEMSPATRAAAAEYRAAMGLSLPEDIPLGTHGRGMFSGFEPPTPGSVAEVQHQAAVNFGQKGSEGYRAKVGQWRDDMTNIEEHLSRETEDALWKYRNFDNEQGRNAFPKFVEGAISSPEYQTALQKTLAKHLPDEFVVFRGGVDKGLHDYLNVTLDPHTAESFAPEGQLGDAFKIKRSDVTAIGESGEYELIVSKDKLQKLEPADLKSRTFTRAERTLREREATHRATLKAKEVLDTTDEKILSQHVRHWHATRGSDRQLVGENVATARGEWVHRPGERARWEVVSEEPIGQVTAQRPLVNPQGNVPGGLREPGSVIEETGAPLGSKFKRERIAEPAAPPSSSYQETLPAEFGPQLVEQPTLVDIVDPHMDWAGVLVENMKGTVYGQDGTLHDELLAALGEGRAPEWNLMKDIAEESQPAKIIGAYEKPAAPFRLNNALFKKINTFVNWAARNPIYRYEWQEAMRGMRPHITGEAGGILTRDEAIIRARTMATKRMLPHIDNSAERTLMAEAARNWIPFYAAQQQAYARMWRLLAEDPAAFRRIQLAYTSLADFGGVYDDANNNQHLVMPGTGWLGKAVPSILGGLGVPVVGGVPAAFSGSLKSLTSVSPFMEDNEFVKVGPLVAIGARALNNFLPETQGLRAGVKSITDPIVGQIGSSQSMWEMVVPNGTMRNVLKSTVINDNRTQAKSVLDAIQFLEFKQNVEMDKWVKKGGKPTDPDAPRVVPGPGATDMERAEFIDRVKNHARIIGMTKAMIGAISPVAPAAQIGDYKLKSEMYDAIKKDGITVAIQKFLEKNPNATPYAVFQTDAGTPSPIESTHPAQQWVRANMKYIKDQRYSAAASYFVPQSDSPFDQDVYQEQMAMGLRRTKSPEQLIKDIESSQGNRWYFDEYKPARDIALGKARSARERRLISQEWAQKGGTNAKGEVVESLDSMKMRNPIWYSNFSSGGRDVQRQLALSQMRSAVADGIMADSPMTSKIASLIEDFDRHATATFPGRTDAYAAALRKRENAHWQNYLKEQADEDPSLVMVINNVFRGAEA